MSQAVLMREYKELSKQKWVSVELHEDNVYLWDLALMVTNPDSYYYGGYFKAQMTFPKDYPYKPPDFRFTRPLWHPNIYPDGRLCISILHAPGEDIMSGEEAGERWSPAQRAETVLLSILSLLDDAEVSSPANVDASVQFRDHKDDFKDRVRKDVEASKKDVPEAFEMPTHESTKPPIEEKVDDDFWVDSDAEELDLDDDFDFDDDAANGSESDEALNNDSEDDDDFDDDNNTDTIDTNAGNASAKSKGKSREEDDAEMTDVE
ncbi:uncharacterized protein HMPREF1541_04864 [Cyphellophora europaea CBS 101466]|uniref:Ubiquitin-conjugating enzyme E2 2 n=1 Tax=Cyphellophora europaea (strain CBS 101466) TaxID=1220924 RepID=W2RVV8_CYPE1|nr:uncharacterized protein HMPREF1541_04864 [Cyphellophora europaea CBS 101466]ETN40587.1 hypothetical protein HMPREF1541_04864 [Cyphellophora europaea CBS 101466]